MSGVEGKGLVLMKNLKRGTRRDQKAAFKARYPKNPWGEPGVYMPKGNYNQRPQHVVWKGQKLGRCGCWCELPKSYKCANCRRYLYNKSGGIGLDESADLTGV